MSTRTSSLPATPTPLLFLAALLFWGWQCGMLPQAVLMGLLLELRHVSTARLRIRRRDINLLADLCIIFLIGSFVYLIFMPLQQRLTLVLMRWMPMIMFPLALAQAYCEKQRLELNMLIPVKGSKEPKKTDKPSWSVNLLLPYFGVVLLAAGSANQRYEWYYPCMFALVAWGLWSMKPRRHSAFIWLLVVLCTGFAGYFGQMGIHELQQMARGWVRYDPFHRSTGIGELGEIKFSNNIAFRVKAEDIPKGGGLLLREASYNFFTGKEWSTSSAVFNPATPETEAKNAWLIQPGIQSQKHITVYKYFPRRYGLVLLPGGTTRISHLPARNLWTNPLGAVKVERADGLSAYTAWYTPNKSFESAPVIVDSIITPSAKPVMEKLDKQLGLSQQRAPGQTPQQTIAKVRAFFQNNFQYSLRLQRNNPDLPPLQEFLEETRSGHCEYFATATVLLLRQAGIPARYVVGYVVQEYSAGENMYVVRERHVHSWVLAYVNGTWHDVDTTPSNWFSLESVESGTQDFWSKWADFRARVYFNMSSLRWLEEKKQTKNWLLFGTIPIGLFLLYRLARRLSIRRARGHKHGAAITGPGVDSDFFIIEAKLRSKGFVRPFSEPLGVWLRKHGHEELFPGLMLHYKYRFDPAGLSEKKRRTLKEFVRNWIKNNARTRK